VLFNVNVTLHNLYTTLRQFLEIQDVFFVKQVRGEKTKQTYSVTKIYNNQERKIVDLAYIHFSFRLRL